MGSIKFDDSGLKKLQKDLEKAAKKISGNVSFDKLFPASFMRKYTNFSNIEELFNAGGFIINTEEDFTNIPNDLLNNHIKATTKFYAWEEMLNEATAQYAAKALKF